MPTRSIVSVREAPPSRIGQHLRSREIHEALTGSELDPFLVVSLFEMTGPVFPPHPHAGFSVATYILPESPIGFLNQDSLGTLNEIAPGGLHATVAGAGVLHEEQPLGIGQVARGYQIWIDHRNGQRALPPRPETLEARDVPVWRSTDASVRVLIGHAHGLESPINLPTAVRLLDVELAAGAQLVEQLDERERGFLVTISGDITAAGVAVPPAHAATFGATGSELSLTAGPAGARVTLFIGEPFNQPRAFGGPVVGGNDAEAAAFMRAASAGQFGSLRPFSSQRR